MKNTMLTQPGAEKLHEELKWLQQMERSRAIKAIRDARDSPDFLESA